MLPSLLQSVVDPILLFLDPFLQAFASHVLSDRAQRGFIRLVIAVVVGIGLVGASILAYAAFYHAFIPSLSFSHPVYFLSSTSSPPWLNKLSSEYHSSFDYSLKAFLDVEPETGYLSKDQAFDVYLQLDLANNERNFELGNFMVELELTSSADERVYHSIRPSSLTYYSPLHRFIRTCVNLPFLLMDWTKEYQAVKVVMMEKVLLPSLDPIRHAKAQLISRGPIDLSGAKLFFSAELSGLRYFMYYWWLPTALLFVFAFLVWSMVFASVTWRVVSVWWTARALRESEDALEFKDELEPPPPSGGASGGDLFAASIPALESGIVEGSAMEGVESGGDKNEQVVPTHEEEEEEEEGSFESVERIVEGEEGVAESK